MPLPGHVNVQIQNVQRPVQGIPFAPLHSAIPSMLYAVRQCGFQRSNAAKCNSIGDFISEFTTTLQLRENDLNRAPDQRLERWYMGVSDFTLPKLQ